MYITSRSLKAINQDVRGDVADDESVVTRFLVTDGNGAGQLPSQVTDRLNTRVEVLFDSAFNGRYAS